MMEPSWPALIEGGRRLAVNRAPVHAVDAPH
jgi:hypothetical protein